MTRTTDVGPAPGEMVMPRNSGGLTACKEPSNDSDSLGTVRSGTLGFVVSIGTVRGWTYVLWSGLMTTGWVPDGLLRRVNQRG